MCCLLAAMSAMGVPQVQRQRQDHRAIGNVAKITAALIGKLGCDQNTRGAALPGAAADHCRPAVRRQRRAWPQQKDQQRLFRRSKHAVLAGASAAAVLPTYRGR